MLWQDVGQEHVGQNMHRQTASLAWAAEEREEGRFVLCHGLDVTKQIGNDCWMHVK